MQDGLRRLSEGQGEAPLGTPITLRGIGATQWDCKRGSMSAIKALIKDSATWGRLRI